jgi:hypothetical protein
MASKNLKSKAPRTHEGAIASHINSEQQLRRSVMACLLWEKEFYEDGVTIANQISHSVSVIDPVKVASMAIEARLDMKLRHVPLLLAVELARHRQLTADTLDKIINRPDELTEFLALYWKDGRCSLSKQVKLGLAKAFTKFDGYQLAKYNRPKEVKLRDVMFLCHAKPKDDKQAEVFKKLAEDTLEPPDTWEVGLSSGKDKKGTWTRLLSENKLGGMALLRNLRNMEQVKVDGGLIKESLGKMNISWILPFRFILAAKAAPRFESEIEQAMYRYLSQQPKLKGKTLFIVDVSGSMYGGSISKYSEMDRANVACSLAVIVRELCENAQIYATAGNDSTRIHKTALVPSRRGFALSDAIYKRCHPLGGGGIFLKQVMAFVKDKENEADRIIVITDEQDCDIEGSPLEADTFGKQNYLINVASHENGIGYGKWVHIDGWSEAVLKYIQEYECSFETQ